MYSKERAQQVVKNDIKYIPAGIQENVALKSARVTTSPQGNLFLEIIFEKDGATLTQTEWKPTQSENMSIEDLQKKEDTQFSRMMQILLCFYKDEELIFNSTTFEGWAEEIANYLNKADKSKLLRVKVVFNQRGYTSLPIYAKYTFIEPMSVSKEDSAIVRLGIDNFTRPVVADKEKPVDPISMLSENEDTSLNDSSNDLPF